MVMGSGRGGGGVGIKKNTNAWVLPPQVWFLLDWGGTWRALSLWKRISWDFPGGTVVKNPLANAGDMGSSPGPGRSHMPRSN